MLRSEEVVYLDSFELVSYYVKKHYPKGLIAVVMTEALEGFDLSTKECKEFLKFFGINRFAPTAFEYVLKKIKKKDLEKIYSFKGIGYVMVFKDGKFIYENV
jgi:hypothetical protein